MNINEILHLTRRTTISITKEMLHKLYWFHSVEGRVQVASHLDIMNVNDCQHNKYYTLG